VTTPPIAYSYIRFSDPSQAKGDSLRRQTEAAREWCKKHSVRLDTSVTLHDLGKSAYTGKHRTNPDRHALAAFLKLVEAGRVPKGSYLIIENLDRLSREDERAALRLWMDLLDQGVNIVQLQPETVFRHEKSDMFDIMRAVMELSRGHGESKLKSDRVGKAWRQKKQAARANGTVLTRQLPAWVEERGGKLALIPGKAAAVRRVLELAAAGYGIKAIIRRLVKEKVDPIGKSGRWTHSYVGLLIRDRKVFGELQPKKRDGTPDGEPIPDYYPAAVSEAEWLSARAGVAQRFQKRGGTQGHLNVFASLLRDARSGESYFAVTAPGRNKGRRRILANSDAREGRAPLRSFPLPIFERAVLSCLREIDPHDILNGDAGPDETMVLAGELARVESAIGLLEVDLNDHGESPALFRRLREREAEKKALAEKLAAARQKAAHPLSESWGECQSLIDTLDNAADRADALLRLRAALRHMVDSMWLLVVPRGFDRLALVQIWFRDCKRSREYLIFYRRPRANAKARTPARSEVWSLADVVKVGDLDLRDQTDARAMEAELLALDLAELDATALE
jgi:DNA invertase Pin-like site-specific DNA recombinase